MIRATLSELDLGELLRALEAARKSAVVSFRGRIYGRVHLLGGRILYARTEPGPHLGEYLVRLGHLTLEEVQELVERQDREKAAKAAERKQRAREDVERISGVRQTAVEL